MPKSSSFHFSVIFVCIIIVSSCSETSPDKKGISDDNERANELYYLAITYSEDSLNQEKALQLYSEAFEIYRKAGNRQRMASVYKRMGFAYDYLEDFEEEKFYLNKALEINKELENLAEQSIIYNFLGICHTISGNSDSALVNYNRGLELSKKISDTLGFIDIYQNMGISYLSAGKYTEAIDCNIKALRYAEAAKLDRSILNITLNIVQLYFDTGDLEMAESYLSHASTITELSKSSPAFFSLSGLIDLKKKDYFIAKESFEQVLRLGKQKESKRVMAIAYTNLANIALIENNISEAETYAKESMELDSEIDNISGIITSLIQFAEISSRKGDKPSAYKYLSKAENLSIKNKIYNYLPEIYKQYYIGNKHFGNYKEALRYYERYATLKDSLSSKEVKEKIAELELSHQNEQKLQQISLLDKENMIQKQMIRTRNFFILSLASLSFALFFLWLFYRQRAIRKFVQMETELQKYLLKSDDLNDKSGEPKISSDAFTEKYGLTQRETDVILLLRNGMSNADIAKKIFVSTNTVKFHMKNIYLKLDVKNRVEALNRVNT